MVLIERIWGNLGWELGGFQSLAILFPPNSSIWNYGHSRVWRAKRADSELKELDAFWNPLKSKGTSGSSSRNLSGNPITSSFNQMGP